MEPDDLQSRVAQLEADVDVLHGQVVDLITFISLESKQDQEIAELQRQMAALAGYLQAAAVGLSRAEG